MTDNTFNWQTFYNNVSGRPARPLLVDVVERFEQEPQENPRKAIDLGCGDGTETAYLLAHGWQVLAIDAEPTAFEHLKAKIPTESQAQLQTQLAAFEAVTLTPADLIYAGFSLPFCHPLHFDALWQKIVANVEFGGRFAGQFFGVHDTWASDEDLTFFTLEQVQGLLATFEVEQLHEEDEDGRSTAGPKHWHIFHVIARKQ